MRDSNYETPIDNIVEEEEDRPQIEQLNQEIIDKRLAKWNKINNAYSNSYNELLQTWLILKEHNLEITQKFEKLENKYKEK